MFGGYCLQVIYKASYWFRAPNLTGNSIDAGGQPLENVIVGVIDEERHQFVALTQVDVSGSFSAYLPQQQLLLAITKPGFIWVEDGSPVTKYDLDTTQEPKYVVVTLKTA